jgi:UDP:flavonoid glycosyltransferase YjiC (YdhE family)
VLETMITSLHGERVNIVATIGRDGDPTRFGAQPDYVRVERFVPQERLLPYVDTVVCHAGASTVLGALAHGVPLVMSPLATDQFDIADQVVTERAGLHAGAGTPNPQAIRDAVRTIATDPAYRTSATALAKQIAAMPTPADVLNQLARDDATGGARPAR